VQQDRIIGKNEIFDFLAENNQTELSEKVKNLFRTCEESRYAFGTMDAIRQPALMELETILKALKL
jgi:hypothetical protein